MKEYTKPNAVLISVSLNDIMTASPTSSGTNETKVDVNATWGDKLKNK